MNKYLGSIAVLAVLCFSAYGQQRVIWNGQEVTSLKSVLWDTLGNETDSVLWTIEILHCSDGKDSIATRVSSKGRQHVTFHYDDRRDLISRRYILEDGEEREYTFSYTYDDAGRLTEEKSFNPKGELMAQYLAVYREDGKIETGVCYVKKSLDFTVWERYYHDEGFKFDDARYFSQANGYFHYNWKERRFLDTVNYFAAYPGDDMYQRFTYQYTDAGYLFRAKLYDIKRNNLENNRYYWNTKLQLRSLESIQPLRDSLRIVWDYRYDHQGRQYETNIVGPDMKKVKRYDYEYEYKGGKLAKESTYYVGEISVHRKYGKHEELLSEVWKDLELAKINELIYKSDGRLSRTINYRYGEIPYEQIHYVYE